MAGFVEAGHANHEQLMDFRDWLADIRNDPERRMARRRSGRATHLPDGSLVPGPFTLAARREILEKLRLVEKQSGRNLISQPEIELIERLWAEDAITSMSAQAAIDEGF